MNRGAVALVLALAALSATGCGTFMNHQPPGSYFNAHGQRRPDRVYGGVRFDGELVADTVAGIAQGKPVFSSSSVTGHDPATGEWGTRDTTPVSQQVRNAITMTLLLAADFPLSFVADTILLPADLYAQWKRLTGPPVEKPDDPPPPEGELSLPTKKDTGTNSWQMSGRIERPVPEEQPAERR